MSVETRNRPDPLGNALRLVGLLLLAVIAVLMAIPILRPPNDRIDPATLRTPYQTLLLSNGLAYFGKVESVNSRFLTLSDVYYIQTRVNQGAQEKAAPNVLVKRGKEWHAPDRMTINIADIVFIEPVAPDSTVGKLIEESKSKGE
ncbi:MAG TPA: hypothetical protein VKU00_25745 [Chthonomonadaceae bacterium]|nr:hypothetical protein [Chthonomonadaceae bacterium]